jgi:hypothetical protein
MFSAFDMRQVVRTQTLYDLAADVNGQENYVSTA